MGQMNKAQKKNVLVTISVMGQFPEMFRIAQLLKASPNYNPIIYFNLGVVYSHKNNVDHCLAQGIDILDYRLGYIQGAVENTPKMFTDGPPVYVPDIPVEVDLKELAKTQRLSFKQYCKLNYPALFNFLKKIYYFRVKFQAPLFFIRVFSMLRRMKKEALFFKQLDVKLLVFGEDSVDYFTPLLIRLGHKHHVKSVVFPYTFANQYEFLEDAFFSDRRVNRNIFNKFVGTLFPKWTYFYKDKLLLKSVPSLILSTELFKISPPNPWVMSSGFSDVLAIESLFMKEYYQEAGIPAEKMIETGYPSLDSLYEVYKNRDEYKAKIATQLKLDLKKPVVLCAVPPSQWPRMAVGFENYEQFINAFFGYMGKFTDVEIIYKFHPRLDSSEIAQIVANHNIKYSLNDTAELIAMCDLYIASVSSTIRWALALGLPTINYDLYDYGYGDFDGAKNFATAVTFEEFKIAFSKMHESFVSTLSVPEHQKRYAVIDGKSGARILNLFDQLSI